MPPIRASESCTALLRMLLKTGWRSVGELEITRRISRVAVCCSRASVRSRSSSAYDLLAGDRLRGVPHLLQYVWLVELSCWHREQCMLRPPSGSEPGTVGQVAEGSPPSGRGQGPRGRTR